MLKPIGLFHTPKDWDELMAWIHAHNAEDKAHLTTSAAMAWNLAVRITDLADGEINERLEQ
jgi:hypothetical protein